jgi:hypothetical protein
MDKATLETPFSQLKFLSSHNTLITHAQMCGTIELNTAKELINQLQYSPVCIELDISEYSMKQIPDTIFIDHNSNRFKFIDNPSKIRERYTMYTDFDETYHPELASEYSIDNVFEKLRTLVEETRAKSLNKKLFPLILSIDISKIKKFKDTIFEIIQDRFYHHFKELSLPPSMRQESLNVVPLQELIGKVIIRINSKWGDVTKPLGSSRQLEFKLDKNNEIVPKGTVPNSVITTHFTRVYPPLFGAMPKTFKKALHGALSFGSKKLKSRKRGSVVRYFNTTTANQTAGSSTVARSVKRIQRAIKPLYKKGLNSSPERKTSLISTASAKNNAASVKSYLRLDCEEPLSYKWISNLIVNYYILSHETSLQNVNSVAVNIHDLDKVTKTNLFGYFKFLYSDISLNSRSTSVSENKSFSKTPTLRRFNEWSATVNALKGETGASGKKKKRTSKKGRNRK